ncbi:putative cub domain low-density lipoprotein receptor domain class a [Caerostris darwini]|uniref:Cub domain low-density lipoprotein receptor domain class a n=1 Tax=Caerostris darwini TaxID=1538125 RepID=A0AAV4WQ31_9ARAC|nr:putative cub domain low-density lipoprotein receptor domain class a [Caerostris darwini]
MNQDRNGLVDSGLDFAANEDELVVDTRRSRVSVLDGMSVLTGTVVVEVGETLPQKPSAKYLSGLIACVLKILDTMCLYDFNSTKSKVGNFTSPKYPKNYSENTFCRYNFKGNPFETLSLKFKTFDLEEPYTKGVEWDNCGNFLTLPWFSLDTSPYIFVPEENLYFFTIIPNQPHNIQNSWKGIVTVEVERQCLKDYVDISTISAAEVKEFVGRYCGNKIDSPLESMHPQAEIVFKSNYILQGQGFSGEYEFRDEEYVPPPNSTPLVKGCGGTEKGNSGVIYSPGYPTHFPKDTECVWLIRAKPNQRIYIRILELQLYGSIANCNDVELSIYDGYSSFIYNPQIMKKYCGDLKYYKNIEEQTIISRRNRLLVRFKTRVSSTMRKRTEITGFKLMWSAVTLEHESSCTQFLCKSSKYCSPDNISACDSAPRFCIANSLVCDGMPNCSDEDYSDEQGLYLETPYCLNEGGLKTSFKTNCRGRVQPQRQAGLYISQKNPNSLNQLEIKL